LGFRLGFRDDGFVERVSIQVQTIWPTAATTAAAKIPMAVKRAGPRTGSENGSDTTDSWAGGMTCRARVARLLPHHESDRRLLREARPLATQ
jgi:hypothetical protein